MLTKKHKDAMATRNIVASIPFKKVSSNLGTRIAEARIALLVAKHTSIRTVDAITDTVKEAFKDSKICQEMTLKRTKCAAIIKNVWYPHFKTEMRKDIGNNVYSLLVDESTDIATYKQLGVVIKYFSTSKKMVVGTFLKMQIIDSGTAESIVQSIRELLSEFNLDIQKCVGIGTDNASVMVGRHNGVFAILKREIKHLVLVPCICHSIQLAISEVCADFFPPMLEFLIAEIYNWFSRSSGCLKDYKGHDPLRITQVTQTRWLSVETAVTRILQQWDELKPTSK